MLYVDASVVLRVALREPKPLAASVLASSKTTSALTEVECLRSLDRQFVMGMLDEDQLSIRREAVFELLDGVNTLELTGAILRRAADPFPTPLGTLDALHLSTALILLESDMAPVSFATHDRELGRAARACGLSVVGV